MKKSILCFILICMLCLAAACTDRPQSSPIASTIPTVSLPASTPSPSISSSQAPSLELDEEKLEAMLPIFGAIIDASAYGEHNLADAEYFWTTIYFVSVNNGTRHPLAEMMPNNMEIKIPTKLVEEYALALFADFSSLPELPQGMDIPITYSNNEDAYLMEMSDQGDVEYVIDAFALSGSDEIAVGVNANSLSDNHREVYEFIVKANPSVSGIADPIFYYSVVSIELVS